MGNSIQKKKKVQTEGNFSRSPSVSPKREKTKGLWLFGRQDKTKTAGPKTNEDQKRLTVHYTTSQHYQENVFIEGSRPQYLEDLHTEAQEGLKILQQEEHKNGVNFPDSESVASTDTVRPEQDISSKDRVFSPESRSTAGSTDTTVTSVSTRPVLTRQGSTFKPLNPVKRLDRSKKRSRRTTIMGIPNQVQKELALQRTSTFQQLVPSEPLNHDGQVRNSQSTVLIIPTVDGGTPVTKREGARVHLSELEQAVSRDEQLLAKHLQAMNQDQQPLSQYFGSYLCPTSNVRPKSLAVPGMTTSLTFSSSTMLSFLQEPQGPVMSISPQATYLSTIIPNAVLPASVEVIEIDRSSSRTHGSSINHGGSVRTVSKSSLASMDFSVSPSLSRRLDGDGSQADNSHNSNILPKSDSGSNWSELQSPNTITMHSSPVSSKGSTHSASSQRVTPNGLEIQTEPSGGGNDSAGLHSSVSMSSNKSESALIGQGCESGTSGLVVSVDDGRNRHNVTRSLSVMKTKQPPAPPRRTNSLHGNKIRSNARVLVESKDLNESVSGKMANDAENTAAVDGVTADATKIPVPTSSSAGTLTQDASTSPLIPKQASSKVSEKSAEHKSDCTNSSPQKTPSEGGKFERTMSPSSGYSSQSGTPTLSPKGITPTSPEKQKKPPVKPDRSVSRASSSAASPSPSLTSLSSGTSETVTGHVSACSPSPPPQETSPNVSIKEPTPKSSSSNLGAEVRELLSIPPPPKVKAPCPPPPEIWVHNRRSFELLCGSCPNVSKGTQKPTETRDSAVKQAGTQTESSCEIQVLDEKQSPVMGVSEDDVKTETLIETDPNVVQKELKDTEHPVLQQDKTEALVDTQKQEDSSQDVKPPERQETTPKKEPPPVMKKPMIHREDTVSKEPLVNTQPSQISSSATPEADLPVKNSAALSSDEITMDKTKNENNRELPTMQTLSVEAPKFSKTSPPPTPPPAYHPTPPLSRKTPTSSVSSPPDDLEKVQEENLVTESSWPPPPPPMEGDSVFDGGEEADFPPPPPPDVSESVPKVMDSSVTEVDLTKRPSMKTGDTIEDVKTETSEHEQTPNVPPVVSQGISDTKPGMDVQVSKAIICNELDVVPAPDKDQPAPPVDIPTLKPATTVETPESVHALPSASSLLNQDVSKTENQSLLDPPVSTQTLVSVPLAPPLPAENFSHGVSFRRQPSVANRDTRSKELLTRHKSAPIPKEDANIPLVTPSLLQMVRLRSVNMTEDAVKAPSEDKTNQGVPPLENSTGLTPGSQNIPQKPIRKSLSLKSPPKTVKTPSVSPSTPSMRLQEAIRMKTAAMSPRDVLPSRLGVRSPPYSFAIEHSALSQKSPDGYDMHKSTANTASFIFSRSTKKVIIEPAAATTPQAQASVKQSLAAELMQMTDQSKTVTFSNGGIKSDKVPPPVARKPAHGGTCPSQSLPVCSAKVDFSVGGNGAIGVQNVSGITHPETTTRVTADTIETLF